MIKSKKERGIILSDFKLFYKAIVTKTVWYWQRKQTSRLMEQNREARNKPTHIYVQLIYEKRAKNIYNGEIRVSSINNVGKIEQPHMKE